MLPRLHRRAREDDAADLAVAECRHRHDDGEIGFSRSRRSHAERHSIPADRREIVALANGLRTYLPPLCRHEQHLGVESVQLLRASRSHHTSSVVHLMRRQAHPLPMAEEQLADERPHRGDIRFCPRHRNTVAAAHHTAGEVLLHDLKEGVAIAENRIRLLLILKFDDICRLRQRQSLLYKILDGRVRRASCPQIKEQYRLT